jgi:hypothetical protein
MEVKDELLKKKPIQIRRRRWLSTNSKTGRVYASFARGCHLPLATTITSPVRANLEPSPVPTHGERMVLAYWIASC